MATLVDNMVWLAILCNKQLEVMLRHPATNNLATNNPVITGEFLAQRTFMRHIERFTRRTKHICRMRLSQVPLHLRYNIVIFDFLPFNSTKISIKAVRAYARHQQNEGKPIAHPHAKEAIAAIASAEVCCQYDISIIPVRI
jgi:hypothetical protein